ncbi:MAG: glutaredoxin domain-containing protein [Sarcina sp.]
MIKVYSVEWCPPCNKLKKYLDKKGLDYEVVTVADSKEDRDEVLAISGQRSVPVLKVNEDVVVGFEKKDIDMLIEKHNL